MRNKFANTLLTNKLLLLSDSCEQPDFIYSVTSEKSHGCSMPLNPSFRLIQAKVYSSIPEISVLQ